MEKLDLTREYKESYKAPVYPQLVELDPAPFLTIEGKGEPAGQEFNQKVSALYPLAYGVKKICKLQGKDFGVPKLEGLWWVDSDKPALEVPRNEWQWKLLIRMPDFVTSEMVEQARADVIAKKKLQLVNEMDLETIHEGQCVQIMHVGPYSTEPESLSKMENYMNEKNLEPNGLHHEVYLFRSQKGCP